MDNPHPELQLLESIYNLTEEGKRPALVSQRELANSAGLSLGLTNTLLKRFMERGWVKLLHVDGRKIMYALTPMGMEEIAVRAVRYFARAAENASLHRKKIDVFVKRIADRGFGRLLLLGPAEVDFLVEYSCLKHGVRFFKSAAACMQELEGEGASCGDVVAICADERGGDEVPVGREMEDEPELNLDAIKRRAGLPLSVPLIRFSQILMSGGGEEAFQ